MKKSQQYDVIVIGGGPSGLMAAIAAGDNGASTLLVDKGDRLGQKLAISGGGRCNVTNAGTVDHIIRNLPGNGRFLYSAFSHFDNISIIRFFEELGIRLKEEDHGRMFPVTDKAQTVVNALLNKARQIGVQMMTNAAVEQVLYQDGQASGVSLRNGSKLGARCVIIATGGKSVPHTGSTGDGYAWAQAAGHTITELYPTEVPLTSAEPVIQERLLQGLSLRDVELSVLGKKNKPIIRHRGDLVFTHFGLSGPIALRCSQFVVKERKKNGNKPVDMAINLFPDDHPEKTEARLHRLFASHPDKIIRNGLKSMLPDRMIRVLLERIGIGDEVNGHHFPAHKKKQLAELLHCFRLQVNGTLPLEKAFVTGGGVHVKEIDPRTMESRRTERLFFCGEILDIHGYTGGYNITAAFVSGRTAGYYAAERARSARSYMTTD